MKIPSLSFLLALGATIVSHGAEIAVDFTRETGPVKPVNAVGQPPITSLVTHDMFHYLKEAGIPYSRLHDTYGEYGSSVYVDIPNIFRDFDADEEKPENYDFAFTDILIRNLIANGVEPFYRLGVTIENYPQIRTYRIHPPKDEHKWARIASTSCATTRRAGRTASTTRSPTGRSGTRRTSIPIRTGA